MPSRNRVPMVVVWLAVRGVLAYWFCNLLDRFDRG